jgi:hypothetical protein
MDPIDLPLDAAQTAIGRAWKMWLDQKHFATFPLRLEGGEKVTISYRRRGKAHEFEFPAVCQLSRRDLRELKRWWEDEAHGAVLMPVQQKFPGVFGANAYFRSRASGDVFNFHIPVRGR